MNRTLVLSFALAGLCLNGKADTNATPSACPLYSLPAIQLRPLAPAQGSELPPQDSRTLVPEEDRRLLSTASGAHRADSPAEPDASAEASDRSPDQPADRGGTSAPPLSRSALAASSESMELSSSQSQFFRQIYRQLDEGGYLTKPEVKPDGFLARFAESFEPEVIHLGKHTTLSCTLITAIKHKNPLCLINPVFLVLSW